MELKFAIKLDASAWVALLQNATHEEMVEAFETLQKFFSFIEGRAVGNGDLSAAAWGEMAEDAADIAKNARKIALLHTKPVG